ncbi:hypothetical protein O3P69_018037 [Scylla paramamosain]|uniref:Uncharacterized protein n=1 Tax=Scylla paramamosain TaxID=85552 RepID=A0AAW0TIJ0_SCYPA
MVWECQFEMFLVAVGGNNFTAIQKKALLLHGVGAEVRQHGSESTAEYVAELWQLAHNCQFGALAEEMIRDQVVEKTVHLRLCERFLQNNKLMLDVVVIGHLACDSQQLISHNAGVVGSWAIGQHRVNPWNPRRVKAITTKLYGVGRTPLVVIGTLPAMVSVNSRQVTTNFYIVNSGATEAIMGLDLLAQLVLTIHTAMGEVFAVDHKPVTTQLRPLPAIKGYQHKIVLKDDATPVHHKLQRLPFSVREEVLTELQNLVEKRVIEDIDALEWVSPVVVSRKKCGKIRLCVDLRGPNSQLVLEVHPLPMIAELHTKLHGVVFSQIDLSLQSLRNQWAKAFSHFKPSTWAGRV